MDSLNLKESDAIHAQRRYQTHFGPLNSQESVANHTLVFINAPGLVEEDYHRARQVGSKSYADFKAPAGGTVDFLRSLARHDRGMSLLIRYLWWHS
jgi:ethanolamine phosphate phosphodiesterase